MDTSDGLSFEENLKHQRLVIFRIYNYYRIGLSFLFLFIFIRLLDFVSPDISQFVGRTDPELFQTTIVSYVIANIAIGIFAAVTRSDIFARPGPILTILTADIIILTLLMFASGGISSGLGNFLIFTVSFAGGLIRGKISTLIPAIAFILTTYSEFYLFFLGQSELQGFFQAGILGIVYFAANILFQTTSRRLQASEREVFTLEQINQYVIDSMRTGVVVVSDAGDVQMLNTSAQRLLEDPESSHRVESLPPDLLKLLAEWNQHQSTSVLKFNAPSAVGSLIATISDLFSPKTGSDKLIFIEDSEDIQKQAQQLNLASLGRLSATIAHEIRNPLGAISHAAQLLGESDQLPRGDLRLAEIIQDHCIRVNKVVENVLQLSRRKPPEPRNLTVQHWLGGFIEDFESSLQPKPTIRVDVDPQDLTLNMDPLHLSQVLGNLCQNGIRYSEKKTGEAQVDIHGGIDSVTGRPFLEVIDYGEGVEEDQVQNLFEPFYTTETTGTGIGLYLSQELCQSNHAKLTYSRASTGGSCFKVVFLEAQKD